MPAYLVPIDRGRPIVIDKAVIFVGRHPECDVVLTSSRKISRRHCCICQVNERLLIRDLGSMNGIRLNGKRVKREATLALYDEIVIGDTYFRVQAQKEAPAQESASSEKRSLASSEKKVAPPVPDPAVISTPYPIPIPEESDVGNESILPLLDSDIQGVSRDEHRDYGDSDSINDLLPD